MTITISFESTAAAEDSKVLLRLDDQEDTTWEVVSGAAFADGVATLETTHFSIYRAAKRSDTAATCSSLCPDVYECTGAASVSQCVTQCGAARSSCLPAEFSAMMSCIKAEVDQPGDPSCDKLSACTENRCRNEEEPDSSGP